MAPRGAAADHAPDPDAPPAGPDLYAALGVAPGAAAAQLKRAYRTLAMRNHPDKNPGDEACAKRFALISHAYGVLSDPARRAFYDDNGSTEGIDVSVEEYVTGFKETMEEMIGATGGPLPHEGADGMVDSIRSMVAGLSEDDLRAMPPFPFPKELFPEGTFPEGMRFSSEGLGTVPPAVAEMLAKGDTGAEELSQMAGKAWQDEGQDGGRRHRQRPRGQQGQRRQRQAGSRAAADFDFAGLGAVPQDGPLADMSPQMAEMLMSLDLDEDEELSGDQLDELLQASPELSGELFEMMSSSGMIPDGMDPSLVAEMLEGGMPGMPGVQGRAGPAGRAGRTGNTRAPARAASDGSDSDDGSAATLAAAEDAAARRKEKKRAKNRARKERKAHAVAAGEAAPAASEPRASGGGAAAHPMPAASASQAAATAAVAAAAPALEGEAPPANVARTWLAAAKDGCSELMGEALKMYPGLMAYRGTGIGNTALHWAVAKGHDTSARWLLEHGADSMAINAAGATALHTAAANGEAACAAILAEAVGPGALAAKDAEGRTPAQLARTHDKIEVARMLERIAAKQATSASATPPAVESEPQPAPRDEPPKSPTPNSSPTPQPSPPARRQQPKMPIQPARAEPRPAAVSSSPTRAEAVDDSSSDSDEGGAGGGPSAALKAKAEAAKARGNAAFKAGDHTRAATQYSMAIRLCPNEAVYWSNRSGAHCALGKYEAALEDAKRAIKLRPAWAKAHARKGAALVGMGQAGEGVKAYKAGLAACPDSERSSLEEGLREAKAAIRAHQHRFEEMWGDKGKSKGDDQGGESRASTTGGARAAAESAAPEASETLAAPSLDAASLEHDAGGGVECGDAGVGGSPTSAPAPPGNLGTGAGGGGGGGGQDAADNDRSSPLSGSKGRSRAERLAALRREAVEADAREDAAEALAATERERERAKADEAAAACGVLRDEGRGWLEAAKKGELPHLAAALARNAKLLQYAGEGTSLGFTGHSALHWGASKGKCDAVRWLLKQGADVDARNKGGGTALHAAAQNNQLDAARVLLFEGGADGFIQDDLLETPKEVAVAAKHSAFAEQADQLARLGALHRTPRERWGVRAMRTALVQAGIDPSEMLEKSELQAACATLLVDLPPLLRARRQ